jgi:hypothetical protein
MTTTQEVVSSYNDIQKVSQAKLLSCCPYPFLVWTAGQTKELLTKPPVDNSVYNSLKIHRLLRSNFPLHP